MKNPKSFQAMNKEFQYLWNKFERDDWKVENLGEYCEALECMVMNYLTRNNALKPKEAGEILFKNYDYIDQSKSEKENNESGPGGGLYNGKMDKYKSVKDFINSDRKMKRKQRKKKLVHLMAEDLSDIPEDVLNEDEDKKDEDEEVALVGSSFINRVDPYPTYDSSFAQPVGYLFDNDTMRNGYIGLYSVWGNEINNTSKLAEVYYDLIK